MNGIRGSQIDQFGVFCLVRLFRIFLLWHCLDWHEFDQSDTAGCH